MRITKKINGIEYEFEIPLNHIIAKDIARSYDGYRIEQISECYSSFLYKVNTSAFLPKERKLIGRLKYNPSTDNITLIKFVDDNIHKFLKAEAYGINNEIIKHLRPCDKILINANKTKYIISIAKALKVGQYLHFDKYELQLFVPIKEFQIVKNSKK